jgi:hypothetical protein
MSSTDSFTFPSLVDNVVSDSAKEETKITESQITQTKDSHSDELPPLTSLNQMKLRRMFAGNITSHCLDLKHPSNFDAKERTAFYMKRKFRTPIGFMRYQAMKAGITAGLMIDDPYEWKQFVFWIANLPRGHVIRTILSTQSPSQSPTAPSVVNVVGEVDSFGISNISPLFASTASSASSITPSAPSTSSTIV